MIAQFLVFALLAIASVLFVVVPLLRRPTESTVRADYDLQVYKDQLIEVGRDLERGVLTAEQAEAARLEIQRRLLGADTEARQAHAAATAPHRRMRLAAAVGLIIAVPIGAALLYGALGHPNLPDQPHAVLLAERLGVTPTEVAALRDEAAALQRRLQAGGGDQEGWLRLADLNTTLERRTAALAAYDRALDLGPVDAGTWSAIGEAHVLAQDGTVSERAETAFRNALEADRREPRARFYMGFIAAQSDKPREAIAIWRDLSAESPPDAPWMPIIRARMAQVAQQTGIMPLSVEPTHPLDMPADGPAVAQADTGAEMRAQADAERAASGSGFSEQEQTMIDGMVAGLKERLEKTPDDFDGWMRLGRSLRVMGDIDGAIDAYRKAANLRPDDLDARFGYAGTLLAKAMHAREKPPQEFFEVVQAAAAQAPDNPDVLYYRGLAARLQGNKAEAERLWAQLRDQLPEGSAARQELDAVMKALENAG